MCLVSWPAKIKADPTPRQQYIHAVDVVPTIYDLLGIEPPEVIKGYLQSPIEGESFAKALTDATVPGKETQFYTMLGQRSIYHQGWLACTVHPPLSGWGAFEKDEWELFHLETDRAQTKNVAADDPERLEALKQLWFYYAGIYNGLPLDDRSALEQVLAERPRGGARSPALRVLPQLRRRARIGGRRDQRSVVHDRGRRRARHPPTPKACCTRTAASPAVTRCTSRTSDSSTRSTGSARTCRPSRPTATSAAGRHVLAVEFAVEGPNTDPKQPGFAGTATLYIDDEPVGSGDIVTQPGYFCLVGDGICVGRDSASPVTPDYADRGTFAFTGGTIDKVVVDVTGEQVRRPRSTGTRLAADGLTDAALPRRLIQGDDKRLRAPSPCVVVGGEDDDAGDECLPREVHGQRQAAGEPRDREPPRPSSFVPVERVRAGVRDRVVEEDGERAEADGARDATDGHDGEGHRADRQLRAVRDVVAGVHGREPPGQVTVGCHRVRRAADAGNERQEDAERGERAADADDAGDAFEAPGGHGQLYSGAVACGEPVGPEDQQDRYRDDRVHPERDAECERDRTRNRASRVLHLCAEGRDAGVAGEREEEQSGRLQEAVDAVGEPGREPLTRRPRRLPASR